MNWRACGLLLLFVGSPVAAAERFQVTFGGIAPTTYMAPAPTSGGRHVATGSGWIYGLRGHLFGAGYDGPMVGGAGATDGWSEEMDFTRPIHRDIGATNYWGLNFALGYDRWNTSAPGNGGLGSDGRYGIGFGRLGAVLHSGYYGLSLRGGVKLPFYATEYTDIARPGVGDTALLLRPDYSLYAAIDYRVSDRWKLSGYFDSHRFNSSDLIPLIEGGQPNADSLSNSQQDSIGVYFNYRF